MLNNRNLWLLVLLLILGGWAAYMLNTRSSNTSRLSDDRSFQVDRIEDIERVFMADRDGNVIDLKKGKGRWSLNDRYEARPWTMTLLLSTIRDIRIKFIPTKAAVKNMLPDMASNGIKVELYGKGNEHIKTYYVGGVTNDERGTYMMMEGSDNMYVMHIPHWEGGVRARYIMNQTDWRDKTLFREDPETIVKVSVEYPRQRNKSFILEKTRDKYTIAPFYDLSNLEKQTIISGVGEAYLYQFEEIYAEAFENSNPKRDSITSSLPFATVKIDRKDDTSIELRLFPVRKQEQEVQLTSYHIDRYFAERSDGDFMLVQYNLVKGILWPYDQFIAK